MRSYWKRSAAALLGAALLSGCTLPAFAAEDGSVPTDGVLEAVEQQSLPLIGAKATIVEVPEDFAQLLSEGRAQITVEAEENGSPMELVLNISEETLFLDYSPGQPYDASQLQEGAEISVYHSQAMTRSLPPQTHAEAIVANLGERSPAHLHQVEQVLSSTEGEVRVLTNNGSMIVTVGKDTPIAPFATKNIVTNEDLRLGARFFAWYDVVAMSMPGQAGAEQVTLLPYEPEQAVAIEVEGNALQQQARVEDGVVMVPLRAVSEALGYEVTWDQQTKTANVNNGEGQMNVTVNEDNYQYVTARTDAVGMSAPQSLGAAPQLEEPGTLWVPAQMFSTLTQQDAVSLQNDVLTLEVK